jgi:polyisoprenoid-binding protein YceI
MTVPRSVASRASFFASFCLRLLPASRAGVRSSCRRRIAATIATIGLALLCTTTAAIATTWTVDPAKSRIGFIASYDTIRFAGTFERWRGELQFTPSSPADGAIKIDVDMSSVNTQSNDRDIGIRSEEWFDVARFATATYRSLKIRAADGSTFEVDATFNIKGQSHPLRSRFTWAAVSNDSARLHGQVDVDRRSYDVGSGDWASDPIIGFKVTVTYDLFLRLR